MTWIQTYKGRKFDIANPHRSVIDIEEIAVVLSRTCRFKGHCIKSYNVAQHSILVCDLVSDDWGDLKLPALLHDAHEVYSGFGDIARPAKYLNEQVASFLAEIEDNIDIQIGIKFGFPAHLLRHPIVKGADNLALAIEQRDNMLPPPEPWFGMPIVPSNTPQLVPISSEDAEIIFLERFKTLTSKE